MKRIVTFEYTADEFETREDLEALTLTDVAGSGTCVYDDIENSSDCACEADKEPDEDVET